MATKTRYGSVDTAALKRLRESFDTTKILDAVDRVDSIRCRIEGLRDELLKLHTMAHDLINDAGAGGPVSECPIWELAEEISIAIGEWPSDLESVSEVVNEMCTLSPDPDED